jgi:hypothetical protein
MGATHPDLFGGYTPLVESTRDLAHPHAMGSGPAGETCGTCSNLVRVRYHDKGYLKCGLVVWSHGPGTDIRLKDAACFAHRALPGGA